MKSPAFQMYVNDFLGSAKVGMMDAEEIGIYLLLLFLDFQENGFMLEASSISKWCRVPRRRFEKAWVIVGQCFVERDGRMYNPRLELERIKQAEWREKSSKGGIASALAKGKGGAEMVATNGQPYVNTPLPSPSPSPLTTKTTTSDSSESGAKAKRFPVEICRRLYSVAVSTGHVTAYPRFRKALLDLYPASGPLYLEAELGEGIRAFYQVVDGMPPREAQFQTVERFVQAVGRWVDLGKLPLVDMNGVTERGRLAAGG